MRSSVVLLLMLVGHGAESEAQPYPLVKRPDELNVSLIQLIANPGSFDGKYVYVGGYLELSEEYENSLFLDENSARSGMTANSIAVELNSASPEIQKRAKELDHTYVFVAGRLRVGNTAFSGATLEEIYQFIPVPQDSADVSGDLAPIVSLTVRGGGTSFIAPAKIRLSADATDSDGVVRKVEFFNGATLLGTDTVSPYTFTWNSVAAGNYLLTAKATDNRGATTKSAAISVTVLGKDEE